MTILRWCWRSAQDAQLLYMHCFSVMHRIFAACFRAGFVSLFRWIPSELNYSDKGSRFFGRDCAAGKSLLHVLAQRLKRSSPARTCDQDCFSPSLDCTSHIHVSAGSVQPHEPMISLCTGHAAAVSSQGSSVIGKNNCIQRFVVSGFLLQSLVTHRSHGGL